MKKLILFFYIVSTFIACREEQVIVKNNTNNEPLPIASCIIKEKDFKIDSSVHVWSVSDTSNGKANAIKIWKNWIGKPYAGYFKGQLYLSFVTYANTKKDEGLKERFRFDNVPKKVGCYLLSNSKSTEISVQTKYAALDDDVTDSEFSLDEFRSKNYLEITKIDTVAKYIEGKFMATFIRDQKYPKLFYLQDTVRFSNGSFWMNIN